MAGWLAAKLIGAPQKLDAKVLDGPSNADHLLLPRKTSVNFDDFDRCEYFE
jgi:hypothetical protein